MSGKQIKQSIGHLLEILDPTKTNVQVVGKKMIVEQCTDARLISENKLCPNNSCDVVIPSDIEEVYAVENNTVVRCVPSNLSTKKKTSMEMDDRVVNVLDALNKTLPKLKKIVEWRGKLSCNMLDTGGNSDVDRGICNATFDTNGEEKCIWSEGAVRGQRCINAIGSHVKKMKSLLLKLGSLENKIKTATFKEFATNETSRWKELWRRTFDDWIRARGYFLQRAYAYEMILGINEATCRRPRMSVRKDICEASPPCVFVTSPGKPDGTCVVRQDAPEEPSAQFSKVSPLWSRDADGNIIMLTSEWPVYVKGYDVIFDELGEETRISENALKGRQLFDGISALELRARRMRLWEVEDIDGQINALFRLQMQYKLDNYSTDTETQTYGKRIAQLKHMIMKAPGFKHGVDAFRAFAMHGADVLEERMIQSRFEKRMRPVRTRNDVDDAVNRIQVDAGVKTTKAHFQFLNEIISTTEETLRDERMRYDTTCVRKILSGGSDESNNTLCTTMKESIKNMEERVRKLHETRDRVVSQRETLNVQKHTMQKKQRDVDKVYVERYGPPPPTINKNTFIDACPYKYRSNTFEFSGAWMDTYLQRNNRTADRIDALTAEIRGLESLQQVLFHHAQIVTMLRTKMVGGGTPPLETTQNLYITAEELSYAFEDFTYIKNYETIVDARFSNRRPTFLSRSSFGVFDTYFVSNKNVDTWSKWSPGDTITDPWTRETVKERSMNQGDLAYYKYLESLRKKDSFFTFLNTKNILSEMILERERERYDLNASYTVVHDTMQLMRIRRGVTVMNKSISEGVSDSDITQFELSTPNTLTVTSLKEPTFMWWVGKLVDRLRGNGQWVWIVDPCYYHRNEQWTKTSRKNYIVCSTDDIRGVLKKRYTACPSMDGAVFVKRVPDISDATPDDASGSTYVKLLSTVFVEEEVSPVPNEENIYSPWFLDDKEFVKSLPTREQTKWLTVFGPYVNPNVTFKNNVHDKDGHILIHEFLQQDALWDLYFKNDTEFFKKIGHPVPPVVYETGGWRPNTCWTFTALIPGYGAVYNVYAHHVVRGKQTTVLSGMQKNLYTFLGIKESFSGTPYSRGDVVWLDDDTSCMVLSVLPESGKTIPTTDIYADLAPENNDYTTEIKSDMGILQVPFYTVQPFKRDWYTATVVNYDEPAGMITVEFSNDVSIHRQGVKRKVGDTVMVCRYVKTTPHAITGVAHSRISSRADDWIKLKVPIQYPTKDGFTWVGPIEEIDHIGKMVRVGDQWCGFETVFERSQLLPSTHSRGDMVVFLDMFTETLEGDQRVYYPNNHIVPIHNGYEVRWYIIKGVEYVEREYLYVLDDSSHPGVQIRAPASHISQYPHLHPLYRHGDRVFINQSYKITSNNYTYDVMYGQWDRVRDCSVVAVNYIEPTDDEMAEQTSIEAMHATHVQYLMSFTYGKITSYIKISEPHLRTNGPSKLLNVHDVVQLGDKQAVTTSDFFLLRWSDTSYETAWTWRVSNPSAPNPFEKRRVSVRRHAHGPVCGKDVFDTAKYIKDMEEMYTKYYNAMDSNTNNNDLTDGSVATRNGFLATAVQGSIIEKAKKLSDSYRDPPGCFRAPIFLVPETDGTLFKVYKWKHRTFDPPARIGEKNGMYTSSISHREKMFFPMWNQKGADALFNENKPGTGPVFPGCREPFSWEQCTVKTRLVGRIERILPHRSTAEVRVRFFPPNNATMDVRDVCIDVTFLCRIKYLVRIDYGMEFVTTRSWWKKRDTRDVQSFLVAGWSHQMDDLLLRRDNKAIDRNTDDRVPWMLKTIAFPKTALIEEAVRKIVGSTRSTWKQWLSLTVHQWMVKNPNADDAPSDLLATTTPETIASAWLELVQYLKEGGDAYHDGAHNPRDVAAAAAERSWFRWRDEEYPLTVYFHRLIHD